MADMGHLIDTLSSVADNPGLQILAKHAAAARAEVRLIPEVKEKALAMLNDNKVSKKVKGVLREMIGDADVKKAKGR